MNKMYEKILNYCNIISGYAFKTKDLQEGGDIPVIKIGNISNGGNIIIDENIQLVDACFLSLDKKYHINEDDILISLTGSHINQPNSMVGRCCRNKNRDTYLLNQRVGKIIPKKNIDPDFIYYIFSLKSTKNSIATRAYGGANQVNVSPKDIMNIKLEFPKAEAQKDISKILKVYDNLIENNNKRIKLLEQMAENIYKEWFVRFRFPGFEETKFEDGIPKGWRISRIKDFGKIETGKTPSTEISENYGGNILFIKTPDMNSNVFVTNSSEKLSEKVSNTQLKKLLPPKSIMVSCIGTGGVVALNAFQAHTNQQINSIVLKNELYLEWLFFLCRSLKITIEMFGATGSTMTNLSKGKFEKLKLLEPPQIIISSFHRETKDILNLILKLQIQNNNLITQRDLLLPRLMSGKLEVE